MNANPGKGQQQCGTGKEQEEEPQGPGGNSSSVVQERNRWKSLRDRGETAAVWYRKGTGGRASGTGGKQQQCGTGKEQVEEPQGPGGNSSSVVQERNRWKSLRDRGETAAVWYRKGTGGRASGTGGKQQQCGTGKEQVEEPQGPGGNSSSVVQERNRWKSLRDRGETAAVWYRKGTGGRASGTGGKQQQCGTGKEQVEEPQGPGGNSSSVVQERNRWKSLRDRGETAAVWYRKGTGGRASGTGGKQQQCGTGKEQVEEPQGPGGNSSSVVQERNRWKSLRDRGETAAVWYRKGTGGRASGTGGKQQQCGTGKEQVEEPQGPGGNSSSVVQERNRWKSLRDRGETAAVWYRKGTGGRASGTGGKQQQCGTGKEQVEEPQGPGGNSSSVVQERNRWKSLRDRGETAAVWYRKGTGGRASGTGGKQQQCGTGKEQVEEPQGPGGNSSSVVQERNRWKSLRDRGETAAVWYRKGTGGRASGTGGKQQQCGTGKEQVEEPQGPGGNSSSVVQERNRWKSLRDRGETAAVWYRKGTGGRASGTRGKQQQCGTGKGPGENSSPG
ncbi:UNVERIFIED_CONTAM: hypothetical protein FKN15_042741 [Acipenser sinensis]